jgi:hypothetical protein
MPPKPYCQVRDGNRQGNGKVNPDAVESGGFVKQQNPKVKAPNHK